MNRFAKVFLYVIAVVIVLLGAGITATVGWRPFIGPRARPLTNRKFEPTPERLARGRYLVTSVTICMDCHSPHDWKRHDAAAVPGMEGAGQDMSILQGLPGRVVASNLTPDPETGVGNWSDDALARAIREGIGHDGRTLFPMMPYQSFSILSDEDLASIVVYLRSLPPVRNPLPKTEIIFPVKYLIRAAPQPVTQPVPEPDVSERVKRGTYLARIAGCGDCHTPMDKGNPIPGMEFAGGQIFDGPWGRVASANLTQDATGISHYNEGLFMAMIWTGVVRSRLLNQIMPWHYYRNMTEEDLSSIFAYLKTLKPVKHVVNNTESPTFCELCRATHGGGAQNHESQ